jgi:hypothetical protein
LNRRRQFSDRFLTVVVEKRRKIETFRPPLMNPSANIPTLYLTSLLNSHQTDTNREKNFTKFSFTKIFLWFDGLKTKRLYFSSFLLENPIFFGNIDPLFSSFFTTP